MKKWFTKKYPPALSPPVAVTALQTGGRGAGWEGALPQPLRPPEAAVYEGLREAVPIVDAALQKIVRLTAGVQVTCSHPAGQRYLDRFIREVPVGAGGTGLETFLSGYLMSLLTYGNAVGEMVPGPEGDEIAALYLSDLGDVELRREESPLAARLLVRGADGLQPVPYPELVFFSALDPAPGEIQGRSLLRGLPFLSGVLMQIYQAVGQNFQRIGALRYAVTAKAGPGSDARQVADTIAREWSGAMEATARGEVRDFVAVGDVEIKVIGADNQILDSEVPVRQILEQLVAKTGIPPFMLGLSWSSTERMSAQQADILTSELTAIRRGLTPVVERICRLWLRLHGWYGGFTVVWDDINLQDQVEEAKAAWYRQQARQIAQSCERAERGEE